MKNWKSIFVLLAVLLCAGAIRPPQARAQFIGFTSPQTVQQDLTGGLTACTGAGQNFSVQNLGQTQHFATVSPTVTTTNMTMVILGVDALGNRITISDTAFIPTNSPNIFSVTASGYYPIVIVQVTCTGGSFTLAYSGTSSTPYVNAGAYLATQIDKSIFVNAATSGNHSGVFFVPTFGSSFGKIVFQYHTAGIAGSTIQINCGTNGTNNTYASWTFTLANVTTVQIFQIPNSECARVQVAYVSGGASANSFSVDYLLTMPGQNGVSTSSAALNAPLNLGASIAEKGPRWQIQSFPAASGQATATKAAIANVNHVADCITWSAGAVVAPALTQLQVILRDGNSGVGTIIWLTNVVATAAVGNHGSQSFCGLNLIGSVNTAMTIEFDAALASELESVILTGYDVQ